MTSSGRGLCQWQPTLEYFGLSHFTCIRLFLSTAKTIRFDASHSTSELFHRLKSNLCINDTSKLSEPCMLHWHFSELMQSDGNEFVIFISFDVLASVRSKSRYKSDTKFYQHNLVPNIISNPPWFYPKVDPSNLATVVLTCTRLSPEIENKKMTFRLSGRKKQRGKTEGFETNMIWLTVQAWTNGFRASESSFYFWNFYKQHFKVSKKIWKKS